MDVAQIAWWRDGRPIDNDEEVVWGYMYVSLTPAVRTQLELSTEPLQVDVCVRRDCEQESKEGKPVLEYSLQRLGVSVYPSGERKGLLPAKLHLT